MVEVMAVADACPRRFKMLGKQPVPISSLTWIVNLLTPAPTTTMAGGCSREVRACEDGCSSQTMMIWKTADAYRWRMQSVAIFG